jgi:hypothetical protein
MTESKPGTQSNLGLVLGLIGGVAGITFFLYLVGVAVEYRRLKTMHLPTDQVVSARPRDLLLIIGVRSLVVPLFLAGGAALLVALLPAGRGAAGRTRGADGGSGRSARNLAIVVVSCALAAAAAAFIIIPGADLRGEHAVLVALVVATGGAGWLAQQHRQRPTHTARLVFVATALAGAVVVYVHAMRPPIHFDAVTIVETNGRQIKGFSLGQSADAIFLAPTLDGDHACRMLVIVPSGKVASISLTRGQAVPAKQDTLNACARTVTRQ